MQVQNIVYYDSESKCELLNKVYSTHRLLQCVPHLHDPAMFLPALGCCDMSSSTLMMLQGVLSHSQDGAMCPLPRSGYCTSKPRKLTNSKSYQLSSPIPLQVLEVVHHQPPPPVEEVVHQPPH